MSQCKKIKLTSKEAFGVDVDNVSVYLGEIPARPLPPGVIRYLSPKAVEEGMLSILHYPLYPVALSPTQNYTSMKNALSHSALLDNGKAIIQPYQC